MAGHERPPQRHRTIEIIDRSQQPAHRQRATASELGDSDIGEAIALIGLPDLIVPARKPHRQPIVDLAVLNRMRIAGLQNELTREVREIDREDDLTPHQVFEIDNLLNKYCECNDMKISLRGFYC
jgi:hypothetical protein